MLANKPPEPRLVLCLVGRSGALEPHPLGAALVAERWLAQFEALAAQVERERQKAERRKARQACLPIPLP